MIGAVLAGSVLGPLGMAAGGFFGAAVGSGAESATESWSEVRVQAAAICGRCERMLNEKVPTGNIHSPTAAANQLFSVWMQGRSASLLRGLKSQPYTPSEPFVAVLYALKAKRMNAISAMTKPLAAALAQALVDKDPEVRTASREFILSNRHSLIVTELARRWSDSRGAIFEEILSRPEITLCPGESVCLLPLLKFRGRSELRDQGPQLLEPLIAASNDSDPKIAQEARRLLCELRNQDTIEALCASWTASRSELLESAIRTGWYRPATSLSARVRILLTFGSPSELSQITPDELPLILTAGVDSDQENNRRALEALAHISRSDTLEALCQVARAGNQLAEQSLSGCKFRLPPESESYLYLSLLTGRVADLGQTPASRIGELIDFYGSSTPSLAANARRALMSIRSEDCLEALFRIWSGGSKTITDEVVLQLQSIPDSSLKRWPRLALLHGRADLLYNQGARVIPYIEGALSGKNPIAQRTARCLAVSLRQPEAILAMCRRWHETRELHWAPLLNQQQILGVEPSAIWALMKLGRGGEVTVRDRTTLDNLLSVAQDVDSEAGAEAQRALASQTSPTAARLVIEAWVETRQESLGTAMVTAQYRLNRDHPNYWLVEAKCRRLSTADGICLSDVDQLSHVATDPDLQIQDQIEACFSNISDQAAFDALFENLRRIRQPRLIEALSRSGLLPLSSPVAFLLETRQYERLCEFDFDGSLLSGEYLRAGRAQRKRILSQVRQSGYPALAHRILRVATEGESAWHSVSAARGLVPLLLAERQFSEVWRLCRQGPAASSEGWLHALRAEGWHPEGAENQVFEGFAACCAREPESSVHLQPILKLDQIEKAGSGRGVGFDRSSVYSLCKKGLLARFALPGGEQIHELRVASESPAEFGPNGRVLALIPPRGRITLCEIATGQTLAHLGLDHFEFRRCQFLGAAAAMVTLGKNGEVGFWRADTGRHLEHLQLEAPALDIQASVCGRYLAVYDNRGRVTVWNLSGAAIEMAGSPNLERSSLVSTMALGAGGKRLWLGLEGQGLTTWDVRSGRKTWSSKAGLGKVERIYPAADGGMAVSCTDRGSIRVWTGSELQSAARLMGCSRVEAAGLSPDGTLFAAIGDEGRVFVWDLTCLLPQSLLKPEIMSRIQAWSERESVEKGDDLRRLTVKLLSENAKYRIEVEEGHEKNHETRPDDIELE